MENNIKEISCYSTFLLIKYAKQKGLEKDIFKGIEVSQDSLVNVREWTDAYTWTKLARNLEHALGYKPGILADVACEIMKSEISSFFVFFLRIAPLKLVVRNVDSYIRKYSNKNLRTQINFMKDGLLDIYFRPLNPSRYSSQMCDFNRGWTLSTLIAKGYKNIVLTEMSCSIKSNGSSCHYRVQWSPSSGIIRGLKDFFFFRFRDYRSIIQHMEENHQRLFQQYNEIVSLKNEIEASRDFYSHIMKNINEGIVWLDENGEIVFANEAFCRMLQYRFEEFSGRFFWDFCSKDKSSLEYRNRFLFSQEKKGELCTDEFVLMTRSNMELIGETTYAWIADESRKPGFLVNVRDVTERRKIERRLSVSENRYRSLYENSPALIIGLDVEGRIIYANPAMEEISGYSEKELKGMHFGKLVAPEAYFDAQRLIKGSLDKEVRLQEVHFRTKSGEWKSSAFNSYPIFDSNNQLAGIAGIGIDITETRRLNEKLIQSQRMDLLGQMAGGLAHDFNNILMAIYGYSRLLLKEENEATKNYAQAIGKGSERASELIKKLLTFSRGEIGKRENFNIKNIIKEVGDLVIPLVPKKVRVELYLPERECYIKGDSGKLHQCLLNLCMNARDAIGDKSGIIRVRLKDSEKKGYLTIEIQDTGHGIPPDIIERIFDPFFSTKKMKKGAGLGLSVAYGVVRSHRGDILVKSRPGEGTTFCIELPEEPGGKRETIRAEKSSADNKEGKVMIIDDEVLIRGFCDDMLKDQGYSTVQFPNAEDAIEWFAKHGDNVQFAIVDIILPGMDGIEMVERLRTIRGELKVIWMTGYMSPQLKQPPQDDPVLIKPFSPVKLMKAIEGISLIPNRFQK